MEKLDGRKLDHKTLEELRIRAVLRVQAGEDPDVVIRALGFTKPRIYEWLAKYREGGIEALKAKPIPGRPPTLTGSQLKKIYQTVVGTNPLQLQFPFALWTRDMVREWIRRDLKVRLSGSQVGRVLKKLGLSPQRPTRRAWQQDEALVSKWRESDYPKIKEMAKEEGASIYFGDESSVRSDYHAGTTWAPVGQTPVVKTTGARFKVNLISAISPKGHMRFMAIEGNFNGGVFRSFLKRLIHNADRPIYLIVDGHKAHKSALVKKFVKSTKGKLKLFFLPPYSPNLNPDELVWNHLKRHRVGKTPIAGPNHLKAVVESFLRSLQKMPSIVMGFFRHPDTKYAA